MCTAARRYLGKGVTKAVENINHIIAHALKVGAALRHAGSMAAAANLVHAPARMTRQTAKGLA
jgi:hypothetical protein